MEIYVLRDSNGQILGICDKDHLQKFLSIFPYGIHTDETNDIIVYDLNNPDDTGTFLDDSE